MTLAHDAARARRRARRRVPLRHARARRALPRRAPATSRSSVIGNDPARARAVRPGRDRLRPRVLRLRGEVHAGPVGDLDPRRGHATASARRSSRSRATPTGRSAPRASPGSTSCVAGETIFLSEINTIPGFTPISLFPTMPAEGGYTSAPSAAGSSSSRSSATRPRARPAPRRRRTCPGDRPAGRPARRRAAASPARRTRPVRRASAGLSPVRARRGARDARLGGGDLRRRRLVGVRLPRSSRSTALRFTDAAAVEAALADARGENLFRLSTAPLEAALEALPTVDRRAVERRAAGHARGHHRGARAGPRLAGRRRGATSSTRDGRPVRARSGADRRPTPPGLPGHRRPPRGVGRAVGRASASTPSTSTRRPGSPRSRRPTSAARRSRWPWSVTDENGFVVRRRPGRLVGRSSASTRRACGRPSSSRARSACCGACSIGREPQVERVILASETDGTYVPRADARRPTPKPAT